MISEKHYWAARTVAAFMGTFWSPWRVLHHMRSKK